MAAASIAREHFLTSMINSVAVARTCDVIRFPLVTWRLNSVMSSSHPELRNGVPVLSINHGSGTLTLQLPSKSAVTDRRWHRLDVVSDGKVGSEEAGL